MSLDKEARAKINRANAQHSTGPKTEEGKRSSRTNALKHGLAAHTIDPVHGPGEPEGIYAAQVDFWITDLQPQNVFEFAAVKRACRASWKLDRIARYEDASALRRTIAGPADKFDMEKNANAARARKLGAFLMFALNTKHLIEQYGPPNLVSGPSDYDDAPRDADALASFKEGVEWLINAWEEILPYLPLPDSPPIDGAKNVLERAQERAIRLLGVATGNPPPEQNLHEAGQAELKRLGKLHVQYSQDIFGRLDADRCLFDDSLKTQLLHRYEVAADRQLHKAMDTFMKLRKNPELIPPPEIVVETPPEPVDEPPTKPVSLTRRSTPNEATRPTSSKAVSTPTTGVREDKQGQKVGR